MCGINGFTWPDEATIRSMNRAISHRGPDNDGIYVDEYVSLGNRRLAIVDLSSSANQPMCNEKGDVWISFNGEIYNFLELRRDLKDRGHIFKSCSDVETVIHLYEEEGTACVHKLRGMFAFCIYDKGEHRLFLARDRIGIKPLYYYLKKNGLIFSSEIRGILQHGLPRVVDDGVVLDYLYYGRVDHCKGTFFKDIFRLPSGHTMIYDIDNHSLNIARYWNLDLRIQSRITFEEAKASLMSILNEVIRMHMVADVTVGSCLSGGLDSSTIVSLASRHDREQFRCFSAVYPGLEIDESRYIQELIGKLNMDTKMVVPTAEDLVRRLHELVEAQEEPFASTSIFAQFKVMDLARQHGTKVLLDGQGGDELFAGYPYYLSSVYLEDLRRMKILQLIKKVSKLGLQPLLLALVPEPLKRFAIGRNLFGVAEKEQIGLGVNRDFVHDHISKSEVKLKTHPSLVVACYADLRSELQALLRYEDKNSMHFSIEARVPFLDHMLVEFVFGLPSHYKHHNGLSKFILRELMRGGMPDLIIERRDKLGFPTPEDDWIREGPLLKFVENILNSDSFKSRPYFDSEACYSLFKKHLGGKVNVGRLIWRWVNLELWLQIFIDN